MSKKVVIIGGGVSSKNAAELLVKAKDVQVTMIQGTKFVEWPLAMTVVLAHPEKHDQAISPNPAAFQVPKVEYKYGVATEVDASAKTVTLRDREVVPYDALVVATGFSMPLIYPDPGVSLQERKDEVRQAAEAMKRAGTIVISGGGVVGLELAGDLRVAYPDKRIMLLCRDQLLAQFPVATREKAKAACEARKIELVYGVSEDAPSCVRLEPGELHVADHTVSYDVFLPMYSKGPNTGFLTGMPKVLDGKGNVMVNKHLQSQACPEIFAIGVHNIDEGFISMAKLDAQWKTVAANVKALLQGKALAPHKEGAPFMKVPPLIFIGHGKGGWAALDFAQMPPPVKCCCCCGLGGFPCCPPPCCYPLCGPCPCGYCCCKPEGEGPAKSLGPVAFKSMGFHFKGAGEVKAPEQQSM
mmetsp:Transcript_15552/g.41999  ORF Transcript_15552/g.41999 Transcript_15552/m.41999 type:complete len:412 (-) Transcript_15552:765-2000(-)